MVVDDGSRDGTAGKRGARELTSWPTGSNRGKGAALATGLVFAQEHGFDVMLAVDADGQHPANAAREAPRASGEDRDALVLGVRDLVRDGAPRANRFSNGLSNFFLSKFAGVPPRPIRKCGLRRYPVRESLALGVRAAGYAFEAEIILRAVAASVRIVETPVAVVYPRAEERVTHFDSVRDPARIVAVVVRTLHELRRDRQLRAHFPSRRHLKSLSLGAALVVGLPLLHEASWASATRIKPPAIVSDRTRRRSRRYPSRHPETGGSSYVHPGRDSRRSTSKARPEQHRRGALAAQLREAMIRRRAVPCGATSRTSCRCHRRGR